MPRGFKNRTGPKLGFKRKNIPGYYLGVDKLGRHTWKASKRVETIYSRDKFLSTNMPPGAVIALNRSTNVVVIGTDKGRAFVYNPVTEKISQTAFGRVKTIIVRGHTAEDFFQKENGLLDRKIPGLNLTVAELIKKEYQNMEAEPGKEVRLSGYSRAARIGDVLKNRLGHKLKIIAIAKGHVVFENQETNQHGAVNIEKDGNSYILGGDNRLDINIKNLQSGFKDKQYFCIPTDGGSHIIKAKQLNIKNLDDFKSEGVSISSRLNDEIITKNLDEFDKNKDGFVRQIEGLPQVDNIRRKEIEKLGSELTDFLKKAESEGRDLLEATGEFYAKRQT